MNRTSRRNLARYAVDQLLGGRSARQVGRALAAAVVDSGQSIEPEFLLSDIAWELERRHELAIGKVSSAHKLDTTARDELSSQLKKATGVKDVLLEEELDGSLIGGVRIETASRVWDFSISRKLTQLREMFSA